MAWAKPKKILIISSFPPTKCGIGTYAQEQVLALKRAGHVVYTYAFDESSAANFRCLNTGPKGLARGLLTLTFNRFDAVYMHFTNGLIWPTSHLRGWRKPSAIFLQYLWILFLSLTYGKRFHFYGHEISTANHLVPRRLGRNIHRAIYLTIRNIYFHTERELANFRGFMKLKRLPNRLHVTDHHLVMSPKFTGSKALARHKLGLDPHQTIFLCIGFIQHHKGFDQVAEAMAQADGERRHLYIVGSLRVDAPEYVEYAQSLRKLVASLPDVTLREQFVDDEQFDMWIKAADYVVLPYREIWSSGVGARAHLLGTPVLAREHPNLMSQFSGANMRVHKFADQGELVEQLATLGPKPDEVTHNPIVTQAGNPYLQAFKVLSEKKILFVMPTFGKTVKGGAESFIFSLATELAKRGAQLEVWTTDSSEVIHRNHALTADDDHGLPFTVRRFPSNPEDKRLFDFVHRYMNREGRCRGLARWIWKQTNLHGIGMEEALKAEGDRFDVIHLFHYLLGSAHRLSGLFPAKTILHPFIHDEAPVRNAVMRDLFAGVRGVTCNSPYEWEIARRASCGLLPRLFKPIGNGVESTTIPMAPSCPAVAEFASCGYLVFIGRMIPEKNLHALFAWHKELLAAWPEGPGLVFIGEGHMAGDPIFRDNPKFKYLGWVEGSVKRRVLHDAWGLVQLSLLESFSLVIMEAWLEKIPVIVHEGCGATRDHINRSEAGFAVTDAASYAEAVRALARGPALRKQLGAKGEAYVKGHYSWREVCKNYVAGVAEILEWRVDQLPLWRMDGKSSGPRDVKGEEIQGALIGTDFYKYYEDKHRDLERVPESWPYYVNDHLYKFKAGGATIVDIGAGRGQFLSYVRERIPGNYYFGVEPDRASYDDLVARGFPAANLYLDEFCDMLQKDSVDVVTMLHVLEHLPWDVMIASLERIRTILKPGGLLLLEFPNNWSMLTSSVWFWADPTHIRPLHPPTISAVLERIGYKVWVSTEFSPHIDEAAAAALAERIGDANLVKTFYGKQDFTFVCQRV